MTKIKRGLEIKVQIEATVYDPKTGKITSKRKIPANTFLKNFSSMAYLAFGKGDAYISDVVTDISGTSRTIYGALGGNASPYLSYPSVGVASGYKVVARIGTNTTGFIRTQYDVLTFLAEIVYSNYVLSDTGTQKELRITFSWTNGTGLAKDVSEVVLAVCINDGSYVAFKIAISRDVFSPPINVPNGQVLALGYVITIPW